MLAQVTTWLIPLIIVGIPLWGWIRGVNVYEAFTQGAAEAFPLALRILPFMVAIFVALGIFRGGGAMDWMIRSIDPVLRTVGLPGPVVPLVLVRPLSGTASLGLLADLLRSAGPDSLAGRLGSVVQGSTDTTFYVLTLYFGSVGIRRTRYAAPVGLLGDAAGFMAAIVIVHLWFRA